jgi:hypothetical protein
MEDEQIMALGILKAMRSSTLDYDRCFFCEKTIAIKYAANDHASDCPTRTAAEYAEEYLEDHDIREIKAFREALGLGLGDP